MIISVSSIELCSNYHQVTRAYLEISVFFKLFFISYDNHQLVDTSTTLF